MKKAQRESKGESAQTAAAKQQLEAENPQAATSVTDANMFATTTGSATSPTRHANLLTRAKATGAVQAQQLVSHLQRQYGNRHVQRVLDISRKGQGEAEVDEEVEQTINRKRGGGQSLDENVRPQMESAMEADFSGVRVHTDSEADSLNRQLNARAFTTGQDIFFRAGEHQPGSSSGRELLAHELTHVVQQTGGLRLKMILGRVGDSFEQEADEVARNVIAQEQHGGATSSAHGKVGRQVEEEEEEVIQSKRASDVIRRQQEEEEEELIQAKALDDRSQRQADEGEEESAQMLATRLTHEARLNRVVLRKPAQGLVGQRSKLIQPRRGRAIGGGRGVAVQRVPIEAAALITDLERYGREEVLQGLVDAQRSAITDFLDELGRRADRLTGFWNMISGSLGGAGIAGTAGTAEAAGVAGVGPWAIVGGLVAAGGIWWASDWTKAGVQSSLSQARRRLLAQADAHGRQYESTVLSLANSFGERVARGEEAGLSADTRQLDRIRTAFRSRSLQAPSTNHVEDSKWNVLCDRWNAHLRRSRLWRTPTFQNSARTLLMQRRRVRP